MVKVSEPAGEIWKAALEGESKIKLRGTPRVDILCQASLLAASITAASNQKCTHRNSNCWVQTNGSRRQELARAVAMMQGLLMLSR